MANIFATNLLAFVLVLGFLIFAHEAGHFFVAKAFRVRVLVFSFGFGRRLFGFRKGDTDYRVSLIPLVMLVALGVLLLLGALVRMTCEEQLVKQKYPEYVEYAKVTKRMVPYLF